MQNRFAEARKRAGLTQKSVAQKLGKTQGAVSNWEKGRWTPTIKDVWKLAQLYGCSMDDLINVE